jgi:hypothetical protein
MEKEAVSWYQGGVGRDAALLLTGLTGGNKRRGSEVGAKSSESSYSLTMEKRVYLFALLLSMINDCRLQEGEEDYESISNLHANKRSS